MTKEQIIKSIDSHIRRKSFLKNFWGYEFWYVGVTEKKNKRKQAHGHPKKWRAWKASNATVARAIEKHFLDKKMKGAGGGGTNTIWVYVY